MQEDPFVGRPGVDPDFEAKAAADEQAARALDYTNAQEGARPPPSPSKLCRIGENYQQGRAGEDAVRDALGNLLRGKQVTFITSNGMRTRIDFTGADNSAVEVKTGNATLTPGQAQLQSDINSGTPVTPVGQNAANAGFTPGEPVNLSYMTVLKP